MEPDETDDYFFIPEEALEHLPEEWRTQAYAIRDEGRAVLAEADEDLRRLAQLAHASNTMASLRYSQQRLVAMQFHPTMESVLEHEMLTTAFVIAYCRLVEGGIGSGVSRKSLPLELRETHDDLIELRNKRYAHSGEHDTIDGDLEVTMDGERFEVKMNITMQFQVGGSPKWGQLVTFLDETLHERLYKILARLTAKTGRTWTFPTGPKPDWIEAG
jgi:hypothetical protein